MSTRESTVPIRFVTGNRHKVEEVSEAFSHPVEQVAYDYTEIQADTVEAVAVAGAREAFKHLGGDDPLIVEDSGLSIEALDGFPGPYSAYVEGTLGIERVWLLTAAENDHQARFESVIAYTDGEVIRTFTGSVEGTIVAPRGSGGFGYDPIFEVDGRTLAERTTEEKNALSHRGRAIESFASWLEGHSLEP